MKPPVQQRLREFIENLRISIKAFERSINVENSYVNSIRNSIPPDKLSVIEKVYPELNITWLIMGTGEMLKFEPVSPVHLDNIDYKEKYLSLMEEMLELQKELHVFKDKELLLKKESQIVMGDVKDAV